MLLCELQRSWPIAAYRKLNGTLDRGSKKEVDAFLEAVDRKFFAAAAAVIAVGASWPSIYYAALTPLSLDVYYLDTKIFLE